MHAGEPPAPLGLVEKVSFGLGDFAVSLPWNMSAAFLLFFYTDVALLPAGPIGSLFLVSRLLDAGFDLFIGVRVDRTHTRWGRARPYFLFGAVPFGLLCVAIFVVPPWSDGARLAWAAASFLGFGLMFSVVAVPYNALLPMMTVDRRDRMQLSSLRSASTAGSVILATALTMPLVGAIGGGDRAAGFAGTAALFGAASVLLLFNLAARCRERIRAVAAPTEVAVGREVARMFRNRAWVVVFTFTLLNFVRFNAVLSVTTYFAIVVLHRPGVISVLLPSVSGTLLVGSVLAPPYFRRLGVRRGNALALAAALLLYIVLPFCEGAPVAFVAVYVSASLLLSLTMTSIFAMAAETVDYHEALYGTRNEGLLSSGISLSTKLGVALGGALTAYGLAGAGYDARAVTPVAASAIRALYYAPAWATIVAQIACIGFYPTALRQLRAAKIST